MLATASYKQRVIFCTALYETAPNTVPEAKLQDIKEDIIRYSETLTDLDMLEVGRAVRILIDVEGFPEVHEQPVIDLLELYE